MKAAVLHTLGKPPRFKQFPEPIAGEGEVIVHVRAAALKPVDKQMAEGSHYASSRKLPAVVGVDGVGRLEDDTRVYFGADRRTARWHSTRSCLDLGVFRFLRTSTMSRPPPWSTPVCPLGLRSLGGPGLSRGKPS